MFSYYGTSSPSKPQLFLQANGIFELQVTNGASETVTWTIDLKKTGTVFKGKAKPKADVTIILSDDTLVDLASGKVLYLQSLSYNCLYLIQAQIQLNGQKAYMTGKLKTKGNIMLATKLDVVLKVRSGVYFIIYPSLTSFRSSARQGEAVESTIS